MVALSASRLVWPGDGLDEIDDVADPARGLRQLANAGVGLLRLADSFARDLGQTCRPDG